MSELEVHVDNLVTEDDEPVDNLFSAKQQRLLVEPLYSSWASGRTDFLADANVAVYSSVRTQPLVPDAFLSLDVTVPEDWWADGNRCYLCWEYGKPPDIAIEIVSNLKGGEDNRKLKEYARVGIPYYAVFDPQNLLSRKTLRLFELRAAGGYRAAPPGKISRVQLGLTLWNGIFENKQATWLRWCDPLGKVVPTGGERAESERQRADRLADRLRAAGLDPDAP